MNRELHIASSFGAFCADGTRAAAFRMREVDPFLHAYEQFTFNFEGVRNMNDSFANALIAPLVEQLPADYRSRIRFKGCSSVVRLAVASALALGRQRASEAGLVVS